MLYLGIDQHGRQLTVDLRDEEGDVVLHRQVSTKWERVFPFFDQVVELAASDGGFLAIVEVCGFNNWLLELLQEYECREIVVVQPTGRGVQKTDRRDASQLSQVLWVNRERLLAGKKVHGLRRVLPPSREDAEHRQLTAMRKRLGELRTRTLNQIHRVLMKHHVQHECPVERIQTQAARQWLLTVDVPEMDRMSLNLLVAQRELQDQQILELTQEIARRQERNLVAVILASIPGMLASRARRRFTEQRPNYVRKFTSSIHKRHDNPPTGQQEEQTMWSY